MKEYYQYPVIALEIALGWYMINDMLKPAWTEVPVKVGPRSKDRVVILEGLQEGDRVLLRDPTVPLQDMGDPSLETRAKSPVRKTPTRQPQTMPPMR